MRAPNWMRRRRSWAADIITDGSEVEEVEEGGESGEVEGGDGVERYAAETQGEDLQLVFPTACGDKEGSDAAVELRLWDGCVE
jgi:hypothetical protein